VVTVLCSILYIEPGLSRGFRAVDPPPVNLVTTTGYPAVTLV
jgi:hypothetical protein